MKKSILEITKLVTELDVWLNLPNGGISLLTSVRHIPSLKMNLISVGQLTSSGHNHFHGRHMKSN